MHLESYFESDTNSKSAPKSLMHNLFCCLGPVSKLKPITWIGMTICALSALCGLLNFIRCLPFLSLVGVNHEVR